jgi:hypothetical protein
VKNPKKEKIFDRKPAKFENGKNGKPKYRKPGIWRRN